MNPEHGYRFETLGMAGWHTRRHLTQEQLAQAISAALRDHTVREYRVSEDTPKTDFGKEYE